MYLVAKFSGRGKINTNTKWPFFFSNLWCTMWVGDYPQEDLAKCGYRSKRKVETSTLGWHARTYCLNTVISKISPLIMWRLWAFFSSKRCLCVHLLFIKIISLWRFAKNRSTVQNLLCFFLLWFCEVAKLAITNKKI